MQKIKLGEYGVLTYPEALKNQADLYETLSSDSFGFFGFSVPEPVVTLGVSAKRKGAVGEHSFESLPVDRGGAATLHAPGQLVLFPVWRLLETEKGIQSRLCDFHKFLKNKLSETYGIETTLEDPTGLFTKTGKISFSGLRVRKRRVFHGFSVNVCNDLSLFSQIRSCGVKGRVHDSIAHHTESEVSPRQFFAKLQNNRPQKDF